MLPIEVGCYRTIRAPKIYCLVHNLESAIQRHLEHYFVRLIKNRRTADPGYKFGDGIHPPVEGHLEMALSILSSLGPDRKKADTLLKRLTHINTSNPPSTLWVKIQKRHRLLTVAWIEHVGHMKPNKAKTPTLKEAQKQADIMEVEIRRILTEGTGK